VQLFPPGSHPFYAGFGNRNTDVEAYLAVGIPPSKIFVINPAGEVRLSTVGSSSSRATAAVAVSPLLSAASPSQQLPPASPEQLASASAAPQASTSGTSNSANQPSQTYCKSYPSINALVEVMFPYIGGSDYTAPGVGAHLGTPVAVNERFNDVNFWRRPLPVLDAADIAAAATAQLSGGHGSHAASKVPLTTKGK
jgi:hypothetical protein